MTLAEIRSYIREQIEASEWNGKNGAHIKKIFTLPMAEFRARVQACKKKGPDAIYENLGVMRNGAVLMPEGYSGILGMEAVNLRLAQKEREDYAAEKQYGAMPEAKALTKQKTIHV